MDIPPPEQMEPIETLAGYRIYVSESQHVVLIDGIPLVCHAGEYRLLVLLLRSAERVVPFACLLGEDVHPHDRLARLRLRRTISRVRERLWPFGLDIRCLLGQGYMLIVLSSDPSSSTETSR
jgi:DNA-binding response OmpR family regulator